MVSKTFFRQPEKAISKQYRPVHALPHQTTVFDIMWYARWGFVLMLTILCIASPVLHEFFKIPLIPIWLVLFFVIILNVVFYYLRKKTNIHIVWLLEFAILADILALSELLVFTGGTNNPLIFISFGGCGTGLSQSIFLVDCHDYFCHLFCFVFCAFAIATG